MKKDKKQISVIWVVLSFVFFLFPVGMFLVSLRYWQNKTSHAKGGRSLLAVAITFFALFLLFWLISDVPTMQDFIMSFYLFGAGSIIGLVFSGLMLANGAKQAKYLRAVESYQCTTISAVVEAVGLPRATVVNDLQKMIHDGILPEAKMDASADVFTLRFRELAEQMTKTVRCPGCGATAVATRGIASVCEYCGAPVVFENE